MNLLDKLKALICRGLITSADDSSPIQLVQVTGNAGEEIDAERLQSYGITSNPPVDSECLIGYPSADHKGAVVFICDSGEWRVTELASGEVCIYSKHGQQILLKTNGDIAHTMSGLATFGSGSDFVAMAQKVQDAWTALKTAMDAFVPPGTPDGGAALSSAISAAIAAYTAGFSSTNVKAD